MEPFLGEERGVLKTQSSPADSPFTAPAAVTGALVLLLAALLNIIFGFFLNFPL